MSRITLNIFDVTPFRALVLATMLSFIVFTPVTAQDYQKGMDAANSGDYATALKELHPLAEQGLAEAQFILGGMYLNGRGVPQDYDEAVKWFRLATKQWDADRQWIFSHKQHDGDGALKKNADTVEWYRLAAEKGNASAQADLGGMYATGKGVPQDSIMAHMWYNLGIANGHKLSSTNRDDLAKQMTPAAIEKAEAMARECMSSGYTKCGD